MSCQKDLPPQLCSFCSRPAILRCINCDTIYCSSICQIEDWNDHQSTKAHQNKENSFNMASLIACANRMNQTKGSSRVQDRLKIAAMKETTTSSVQDRLKIAAMKESTTLSVQDRLKAAAMKESFSLPSRPTPIETPFAEVCNIANVEPVVDYSDLFKSSHELQPVNENGFCRVVVSNIVNKKDSNALLYYLYPLALKEALREYKQDLLETYNSDSVKRIQPSQLIDRKLPDLFMLKFNNFWVRATAVNDGKPVNTDGTVEVIDIDSGMIMNINVLQAELKPAIIREYETKACSVATSLTNVESGNLDINDIIEVKVIMSLVGGVLVAEVNYEDVDDEGVSEYESAVNDQSEQNVVQEVAPVVQEAAPVVQVPAPIAVQVVEPVEKKFTIKDIKLKVLKPGRMTLHFLDGAKLTEGKMCVFEVDQESEDFLLKLDKDIEDYIAENADAGNYRPIQYELVLAKFTDGAYYRGMCKIPDENETGCTIVFLEYCNEHFVHFKNIIKLPKCLLRDCISRNVIVKLISGRSVTDIDVDASINKLYDNSEFQAYVHEDGKSVTVDDSIFILKNQ